MIPPKTTPGAAECGPDVNNKVWTRLSGSQGGISEYEALKWALYVV
jgi:hypothetical protein